ncbi:MAG: mechanosensitive ion channel family protein [Candidatus Dadabacteria bacterium]|nr:MAG: mechanosensitive ion channel family protein [Candidatus Dadabacteria bacterium]
MKEYLPLDQVTKYRQEAVELIMSYAPRVLLALIVFFVGWWLIRIFRRILIQAFERYDFDPTLETFLISLTVTGLKVLLVVIVAGMIGVEMTSVIALLGAAGFAVGMALSGNLQNFAGGVIILIFRPFQVGDYIEACGHSGTVREIQIFHTVLKTPDNKTVIIPNSPLSSESLINYSAEPRRRVDFTFGIGYGDDIDRAKEVIRSVIAADDRIEKDPEPFLAVSALADSSVNLVLRVWVTKENYWAVYHDTLEAVKKAFDREGISIPYPQRDIHIKEGGRLKAVNG